MHLVLSLKSHSRVNAERQKESEDAKKALFAFAFYLTCVSAFYVPIRVLFLELK